MNMCINREKKIWIIIGLFRLMVFFFIDRSLWLFEVYDEVEKI